MQKQNHKALSDGSEDVLIAFGSIGGTLLFLFLIYAFYKTRRGVPFNEILNFKAGRRGKKLREPPLLKSSDSMPRPDEDRAWNPASTFATATAEKVGIKKDPQKPKMVMIRANSNKSTGSSSSQESDLEKPAVSAFAERSFLKDIDAASSGKRSSTVNWPLHPTTRNSRASSPLIPSIGSLSQSDTRNTRDRTITSTNGSVDRFPNPEAYLAAPFEPPPRLLGGVDTSRFSWSENASHPEPPTPRFALERQSVATSARSSLPRFRKIDSWVSNQTGRLNSTLLRNQPGDVISTLDENEPQQQGGEGGAKARSGPKVWKSVLKGDDELEDVDERETLVEMPGPLARDGAARVGAGPPGGEGHARQVSDATVFRQHPGARMSTPKARRMKSEDLDAKLRMPGAM
ncbi:MAG: hypothetical protein M1822_003460 [Bathelium mastoideum]|nr:MAG: hypothetical protein M1822_003460 [Bathelium mastoideum]